MPNDTQLIIYWEKKTCLSNVDFVRMGRRNPLIGDNGTLAEATAKEAT